MAIATGDSTGFWGDFDRLVHDTESCLFEQACRLERSEARARDLVQDTYERALRHFDRFVAGTNARAWLFRIMSHLFIDRYRRRKHEALLDQETLERIPAPSPEPPCPWENIDLGAVRSAVQRLAPPFQSVLDLHIAYRRSYAEIAAELGIPTSTVGSRLNRARKKIRALLEASGEAPGAAADLARNPALRPTLTATATATPTLTATRAPTTLVRSTTWESDAMVSPSHGRSSKVEGASRGTPQLTRGLVAGGGPGRRRRDCLDGQPHDRGGRLVRVPADDPGRGPGRAGGGVHVNGGW